MVQRASLCVLGSLLLGALVACTTTPETPSDPVAAPAAPTPVEPTPADPTPTEPSDTSEPTPIDTSEPDTSEPDTSEPDTSEPDTSEPDTSEQTPADTATVDPTPADTAPADPAPADTASAPTDPRPTDAPDATPPAADTKPVTPGWAAFEAAATVLLHPRCLNCHPTGDRPLQTDTSRIHAMNVQRGADGKGRVGMRCTTCHQSKTIAGANVPPGVPNWHLAPSAMAFEGRTARQLAQQFKDQAAAKGMPLAEFLHHVEDDPLVTWAFDPGQGRTTPPLSHEAFKAKLTEWIRAGAPVPDKKS